VFVNDPPLRRLAGHVAGTLRSAPAPAAEAAPTRIARYQVALVPRPLGPQASADFAPVTILADQGGVAAELERLLPATGVGAALIDLRPLDGGLDGADARAAALAALQTVRPAANRPAAFVFAQRGIVGGALAGFAKALARERPDARVKCITFNEGDASTAARAIADELRATDATVEVTYANGLRHVSALEPATVAAAARALGPGTGVAIAGGTRGLGAKLAAALADRGCKVAVLGRTPPAAAAATFHRCDVTDAAQVAAALADARRAHGPIEVLVHAAG